MYVVFVGVVVYQMGIVIVTEKNLIYVVFVGVVVYRMGIVPVKGIKLMIVVIVSVWMFLIIMKILIFLELVAA